MAVNSSSDKEKAKWNEMESKALIHKGEKKIHNGNLDFNVIKKNGVGVLQRTQN